MKRRTRKGLPLLLALLLLAGCTQAETPDASGSDPQKSDVKEDPDEKKDPDEEKDGSKDGEEEETEPDVVIEEYDRDETPGSRTLISLEEATQKKNRGEQFLLLFTKEDCSYCAEFNEVLNPYLENHHLDIYEVDMTQAEEQYIDSDREAMLDICIGGLAKTPALYYIESPKSVRLLDHSQANYSEDGLDTWVQVLQLDRAAS